MSKRLDDLKKKYDESRVVAAELNEESDGLSDVLTAKQEQVMETVRRDLREFYEYGKALKKGWLELRLEDCKMDFYQSSNGRSPSLIVAFEPQGYMKLKFFPDGYSRKVDIYDLKSDRWVHNSKQDKAYVTENWGKIRGAIEDELANALEQEAASVVKMAVEKRDALRESIGAVKENIDWSARKDTILYNAISLLVDKTFGEYDDTQEWLDMIQNELGVSLDELEKIGVNLNDFGIDAKFDKILEDAIARSKEHKGFDAYEEIQRLTELRKERPLTQDEEETLFYCKNAIAEQDYYDSLD